MSSDIWNPWHGCRKYSEGCDHCYMHYLDNERGKSGGEIYKVKTNSDLLNPLCLMPADLRIAVFGSCAFFKIHRL